MVLKVIISLTVLLFITIYYWPIDDDPIFAGDQEYKEFIEKWNKCV